MAGEGSDTSQSSSIGVTTGGRQRDVTTGGWKQRDITTGGRKQRDVPAGGRQQRDVTTGGWKQRDVTTGGRQQRDVTAGGRQQRDVTTGGWKQRDITTGGRKQRDVTAGGPQQRDAPRDENSGISQEELTRKTRAFFSAVLAGDGRLAKRFLDTGEVHVNVRDVEDPHEPTPLLLACEKQHYDVIEALLLASPEPADLNLESKRGKRPIWWAARYGDARMAELLLETERQKCEINYLDMESGCTPLYRAILSNCSQVCRALIHAGADVNLRRLGMKGDSASAQSPLIKAVQQDNLEIVDMLMNSLCDLEARTEEGFTALHYAIAYRRYDIARSLLVNNIPIMASSNKGVTALTVAIEHRNPSMCQLLAENNYNVNVKFDWGETPLEMAIRIHSEGCALALVYQGCSLNVTDGKPSYFLQSVSEGLLAVVRVLIEIRPSYLSEAWLRQRYIPLSLYKIPDVYENLTDQSLKPRKLIYLCRSVIFTSVGKSPMTRISKLPLPNRLIQFVEMRDFFPSNLFEQTSIFASDCPYDCLSNCEKVQCTQLDFSSSSEDELDIAD